MEFDEWTYQLLQLKAITMDALLWQRGVKLCLPLTRFHNRTLFCEARQELPPSMA
jgi:hypothetical protein